ncbi:HEAT repeat protein [Xylariaceae sp. FL0804]|nr:HEAT repeat protein [Xylariaceae sp. FL0804]
MPATQSGRIVKARKGKSGTPHQKNHRWESFSTKISKLHSLDPLRRVRRHDLDTEDLEATTSYLRNGLDKWADLNISHGFTSFRREIRPFCDSLPQILHFEDQIMNLLAKYISAKEQESLEPLLELLTAFAHDLGTRFEKHYRRALSLIIEVASRPQDAAVIEWTFACLAFLFKYLSKLLVPDLRPTYDALAPLLGKARTPPHITRFAAEALSFLVKKAAAPANRATALPRLIDHVRQDFQTSRDNRYFELYYHGLMTMLAEAIKGQGRSVYTSGAEIVRALLASVPYDEAVSLEPITWSDMVCGVLVSIVHHTTAESFTSIPEAIADAALHDPARLEHPLRNCIYIRCLGTISGVRKGSRIADWQPVLKCLLESLKDICQSPKTLEKLESSAIWQQIIANTAIVWQNAFMDAEIPHITDFVAIMSREPLMNWFIPFCSYFSILDTAKFRSLFLKPFQKFVVMHWSEGSNEDMLCVFLRRMIENRALPSPEGAEGFSLPQSWQDQIVTKFEKLEASTFPEQGASNVYNKDPRMWHDRCLPKYSALLDLLESTNVRPSTIGPVAELLSRKLKLALRPSPSPATDEARFIASRGFSAYLQMSKSIGQLDTSLAPLLKAATPRYSQLTGFLEAMVMYQKRLDEKTIPETLEDGRASDGEEDPYLQSLIKNLSMPSHTHRQASLQLLMNLHVSEVERNCLDLMLQTEETPLDLQNIRTYSMHIRNLAVNYMHLAADSWLCRAIPSFLFGLTTVKLTPVWGSCIDALQEIGQAKHGEEAVCEMAFQWMERPSKRWDGPQLEPTASSNMGQTDFECRNLAALQRKAEDTQHVMENTTNIMLRSFETSQALVPDAPLNARSQALKVFMALPGLAEKRSRRMVPYFLSWALAPEEQEPNEEEADEVTGDKSWSLFDKKILIGVFAQVSNPKVLYQSQDVYNALLRLLANGDIEVQKSALKAILAWKQEGVKPYQENLEYLLDEARFKNEITVLFQGDQQIKPEHRSEMMPVLLRLLYGRTISKKGVSSGRQGLQATRLAVIRKLTVEDMDLFLDLALGNLRGVRAIENGRVCDDVFQREIMPVRKLVGFLNMMEAIIHELGTSVVAYADRIVHAVLYCLLSTSRRLQQSPDEEEEGAPMQVSLLRNARAASLRCLISLMRNAPDFEWTPYKDAIILEAVSPRLDKFATENSQGISGTLQLLSTLSQLPKTALFLAVDDRIIKKLMECLAFEKAKSEVRIFALGIVRNLVKLSQQSAMVSEFNELIGEELLYPNVDLFLETISRVLKSEAVVGKDLLLACVELVVELSPAIQHSGHVTDLIDVSEFLLNHPASRVNPKIKSTILSMLKNFLDLKETSLDPALMGRLYSTVSSLFGFFKDTPSRQALSEVLAVLVKDEPKLQQVSKICADLNANKDRRIDEPDYETRLAAFNTISQPKDTSFSPREWKPIIYNMIFYIKHDQEYGILSANSADGICRFIDAAALAIDDEAGALREMLSDIVMPAIHSNAKDLSETVRRETVRVFGYLISRLSSWPPVSDLVKLNPPPGEKDPDPSFFGNILSPAVSRQIKALQLLSRVSLHTSLSSRHLAHFFVPLLEHFIFNREESDDHGVGAQAATTLSDIAISLEWPQYRAILRRYIGYVESKPDAQKQLTRLLGKFVDSLSVASGEKSRTPHVDEIAKPPKKCMLATTMPSEEKFNEDVISNILPTLLNYLHEKDEGTVSARVPVGVIVVKLLKLLPKTSLEQKLPGVLTDICHILRSKAWDSREMARDTLATATSILGPSYFGFVLKELRGALTTGYQLHVLSYTMHTILIAVIPQFKPGDLDYCLSDIVNVIMDDIFGVTGQEKDAEEYVSQMKEVKSSKSQDSMELIARTASVDCLGELIRPLQSLLLERLDLRMVRKIDDLLSRVTSGLLNSSAAESRETLVFCYEVIQRVYESEKPQAEPKLDPKLRRYLIQKGAKKSGERGTTSKFTYKLVRFAVDILRAVLRKHDSLRNSRNITGFIPILGDAVVGGEEEVQIASFKLLAVLTKVPFPTDDISKLYKVASKEATKAISTSTSTSTDLSQTALKLMSVVIRDRHDVVVKEAALDLILAKLKDDLTEPLHRHVTFSFLRSVLDRKTETAAVYDTLDYVGSIMITNDDKDTRDLARGAFFQFLRDYPQKKSRWAKQLNFIIANLKYDREGGRVSVMEVLHLLLMKSADDFVQEIATNCFIPLIFVLANDDSEKCRLAAGELIKEIYRKADKERTSKFLALSRKWLGQDDNPAVLRLGIQAFTLYFEAREPSPRDKTDLESLVETIVEVFSSYASFSNDTELISTVVQAVTVLIQKHPRTILAHTGLWQLVPRPLSSSDAVVKSSTIQLIGMYLLDFLENNKSVDRPQHISGSHGLQLDASMVERLVFDFVGIIHPNTVVRWKTKQEKNGSTFASDVDRSVLRTTQDPPDLDESVATEASRIILILSRFLDVGSPDKATAEAEMSGAESEADKEEDDEWDGIDDDSERASRVTLTTLFGWLSDILVEETRPKASLLVPKTAALDVLAALVDTLPASALRACLDTVLAPLFHLNDDPSVPAPFSLDPVFGTRLEALRARAREAGDAARDKVGTADYSRALLKLRARAVARAEARRRKRKVDAVAQPERHDRRKRGRVETKARRRKEKGLQNRDRRREH